MVNRIEVSLKSDFEDPSAKNLQQRLKDDYGLSDIKMIQRVDAYTFEDDLSEADANRLAKEVFTDPVLHDYCLDKPMYTNFDVAIMVALKPGVKDNVGQSSKIACQDALSRELKGGVYTSTTYLFFGHMQAEKAEEIAKKLLCNPLIQSYQVLTPSYIRKYYAQLRPPVAGEQAKGDVLTISLPNDDGHLMDISKKRLLALTLDEMKKIKQYFEAQETTDKRKEAGLGIFPTDAELECIAQTWSEHCKHKIFNATINYVDKSGDKEHKETIHSLFKTYISGTTKKIEHAQKYLVSLFVDNAGVIALDSHWGLALKAETHNSPSALDPFGGALTGILGVNRDVIATGLGSKPIFNTDIFCFAPPDYSKEIPPRLQHPKRVFQGVHAGVAKGGNASGIPTVNGSIVFDDCYLGKPLVYCGTGGLMPLEQNGKKTHLKPIKKGHRIFMVGGRVGKDGIHGATFSSEGLNEGSPTSAVQLGDPYTQKNVLDFLLESRDKDLHSGLQDMGAGGISSAVGELAEITDGAQIHLDRCPLKYPGLQPWEILVSESQERMMAAVPVEKAADFKALADKYTVEATDIGEFTDSGFFHAKYYDKTVLYLDLGFLHNGLPKMELEAIWQAPKHEEEKPNAQDANSELLKMLARPNICSKESIVRQYDHEVLGMSVIKPFCGEKATGPSDAAVIQPFDNKDFGIAISHGICPRYSRLDTYHMAQMAVDEAVRNYICAGGDLYHFAALDNFCWPDPIKTDANNDGDYKLAQLVRANKAMAEACIVYDLPLISGKDSMKNDYKHGDINISIQPTLLISVAGKVTDINKSMSSDFKKADQLIYIVGKTKNELGCSEYYSMHGLIGKDVPKVDLKKNITSYKRLHRAMTKGMITAAHDCSDGGIGCAISEMCIGGQRGARIRLSDIPKDGDMGDEELLYSESAGRILVTIDRSKANEFEHEMHDSDFAYIGQVLDDDILIIESQQENSQMVKLRLSQLEDAFRGTITW